MVALARRSRATEWKALPLSPDDPTLEQKMLPEDVETIRELHRTGRSFAPHEEVSPAVLRACAAFAALQGGQVLHDKRDQPREIASKGGVDLVTDADYASQEAIVRCLRILFEQDHVIAEEDPSRSGGSANARRVWHADPLDGTKNYQKGRADFAVNVGVEDRGMLVAAATLDPLSRELMVSAKGEGTYLNHRRCQVNEAPEQELLDDLGRRKANDALVEYLLPLDAYQRTVSADDRYVQVEKRLREVVNRLSQINSAALALLNVACGRADGAVLEKVHSWDLVGLLHVQEAGGRGTTWTGGDDVLESGNVVASNEDNHPALLQILEAAVAESAPEASS